MIYSISKSSNISQSSELQSNLLRAINGDRFEEVDAILKKGADLSQPLPNSHLPLHYAIRQGKNESVRVMLQNPAVDLLAKDSDGLSSIDHAAISGDPKLFNLVLGKAIGNTFDAALQRTFLPVHRQEIIDFASDLDKIRSGVPFVKLPPLHEAARLGNLAEVQRLLNANDPNPYDSYGMTPLQHAVLAGKRDVVEWLLQKGRANLQVTTQGGRTLVHLAAIGGHADLAARFAEKINPNAMDSQGKTALLYAAASDETLSAARALIKKGADLLGAGSGTWRYSPVDVLCVCAQERSLKRDPLRITQNEWLTLAGIVALGASQLSGGIPVLEAWGNIAAPVGLFFVALEQFKSKQGTAGFLGACAVPFGGLMLHRGDADLVGLGDTDWITGLNNSGETPPRWILGAAGGLKAVECYQIAKRTLQGISNCWKSRSLGPIRPLRNALVYAAIGAYSVRSTASWIAKLIEYNSIFNSWEEFLDEDQSRQDYQAGDAHAKVGLLTTFWQQYKGGTKPPPQNPTGCGIVNPDLCKGLDALACVGHKDLDPKCPDHAEILLGLNKEFTSADCKRAFRQISLQTHPDKVAGREALFQKADNARQTLGC